jgi:hypothetical protein
MTKVQLLFHCASKPPFSFYRPPAGSPAPAGGRIGILCIFAIPNMQQENLPK